ncbi:MAG: DUF4249 family protein [Ferruginibacter sp.]
MVKNFGTYYVFGLVTGFWKTVLFFILFISIISCKKTFTSTQFIDDKLVVLAELTAGDSMEIPIGKTIKVGNGGLIRFEKVTNAIVTITDESAHTFTLLPNYSAQYVSNPTTVFTNRRHIRANATYSIEIKHPTLGIVSATSYIPFTPKLISIDTSSEDYQGKNMLAATFNWEEEGIISDNFYVIEAVKESVVVSKYFFYLGVRYNYEVPNNRILYNRVKSSPGVKLLQDTVPQNLFTRINLYTADNNTENSSIDKLENPFRRIFIPGRNGQFFSTKVFVDRQFFNTADVKKKGRIRLQLKSVGKELYNYLLVYEKYKTDFGSVPTSQLISPLGNVQNGLGIFGGSARRELIFYFDNF